MNEWAEGNHLEPCQKWGRAFLEKTKTVKAFLLLLQTKMRQLDIDAGNISLHKNGNQYKGWSLKTFDWTRTYQTREG